MGDLIIGPLRGWPCGKVWSARTCPRFGYGATPAGRDSEACRPEGKRCRATALQGLAALQGLSSFFLSLLPSGQSGLAFGGQALFLEAAIGFIGNCALHKSLAKKIIEIVAL